MTEGSHFLEVADWSEAESRVGFAPLRPRAEPTALRIHVRDHKLREVEPTLEASFGSYSLSQGLRDPAEAKRLARVRRYGPAPVSVDVAGLEAVAYELGPMPDLGDIDPRLPAVVTWADDALFVLVASGSMACLELIEVARSLYPARHETADPAG